MYKPFETSKEDVNTLKHNTKDMGYNPDRYASDETMEDTGMMSFVSEKKELIVKVSHNSEEKHLTFDRIKQLNRLMKEKAKASVTYFRRGTADIAIKACQICWKMLASPNYE